MPIDAHQAVTVVAAAALVTAMPGPSVLLIMSRGISIGRSAAIKSALGSETGALLQVALVAGGLAPLLERSVVLYGLTKALGAAYLVYVGIHILRRRRSFGGPDRSTTEVAVPRGGRVFLDGFLVGALNPKGVLLFAAILPQFTDPTKGSLGLQMLILGSICVLVGLTSDMAWVLATNLMRSFLAVSQRRLQALATLTGCALVAMGLRVAIDGRA